MLRQIRELEKGNTTSALMNQVAAKQAAKRGNRFDV